jgi:hypothetical protein
MSMYLEFAGMLLMASEARERIGERAFTSPY